MPTSWKAFSMGLLPFVLIVFSRKSITDILLFWTSYNCTLYLSGGTASMFPFLFKFTLV
jgi:hypothetical protein